MMISLDIRLLIWLLSCSHKAHWSDADLGSHLQHDELEVFTNEVCFFAGIISM